MASEKGRNYFPHDSNARNDSKIIALRAKHGMLGYGVYFGILERLREETGYQGVKDYNIIAFDLRVDAKLIKSVVEDFGLFSFTQDGESFYSERMTAQMDFMNCVSEKRSSAGKKGAQVRFGDSGSAEIPNGGGSTSCEPKTDENSGNSKCLANATDSDSKCLANATENDSKCYTNYTILNEKKIKEKKMCICGEKRPQAATDTQDFFEIFLSILFFRNVVGAQAETKRFMNYYDSVAWTLSGAKKPMSLHQRIAKAELWKPQNEKPRFPSGFLDAWRKVYDVVPNALKPLALSDKISVDRQYGCMLILPTELAGWISSDGSEIFRQAVTDGWAKGNVSIRGVK